MLVLIKGLSLQIHVSYGYKYCMYISVDTHISYSIPTDSLLLYDVKSKILKGKDACRN